MIICNAERNGRLCSIEIADGKIAAIRENTATGDIDAAGCRVIPGLIDVHTHGCMGWDTMDADLAPLCRAYAAHGTTAFLPTTMTSGTDRLRQAIEAQTVAAGAEVLGFHLEGPYISPVYKGAQNERDIRPLSVEVFRQFSKVRMITVAPEMPDALAFIRAVSGECVVSLGHTGCDYETALEAIAAGASCLTHLYNAMPPLHHRRPGPIGAAVERGIYVQLICDGVHVSKPMVQATYKLFGAERVVLISDSIRCAGLPEGMYESGGLMVQLRDGVARLADGTIAGSCATLLDCVKTAVSFGVPWEAAVRSATRTPAELLGLRKGCIEVGYDADLLLLDEAWDLRTVIIGGTVFT